MVIFHSYGTVYQRVVQPVWNPPFQPFHDPCESIYQVHHAATTCCTHHWIWTTWGPGLPILRYTWRHSRTLATIFCHRDGSRREQGAYHSGNHFWMAYVGILAYKQSTGGIMWYPQQPRSYWNTNHQDLKSISSLPSLTTYFHSSTRILMGSLSQLGLQGKKCSIPVAIDANPPGNLRWRWNVPSVVSNSQRFPKKRGLPRAGFCQIFGTAPMRPSLLSVALLIQGALQVINADFWGKTMVKRVEYTVWSSSIFPICQLKWGSHGFPHFSDAQMVRVDEIQRRVTFLATAATYETRPQ